MPRKIIMPGHQLVNADCSKLSPTSAVSHNPFGEISCMRYSTNPTRRSRRCWRWTNLPAESSSRTPVRKSTTIRLATSHRVKSLESLLRVFQTAVINGRTTQLAAFLSSDLRLTTDTGGKPHRRPRVLEGEDVFSALGRAHAW